VASAYAGAPSSRSVAVGTVKANVGHVGHSSGAAALIKTALCLHGRYLPQLPRWSRPQQHMQSTWEGSQLYACASSRAWVKNAGGLRRAAVSGVAASAPGSAFHVLLSDVPACHETHNVLSLDPAAPKLVTLRASTAGEIVAAVEASLARIEAAAGSADAEFGLLLHQTVVAEASAAPLLTLCLVTTAAKLATELKHAAKGVGISIRVGKDYTSPSGSFFTPSPMRSDRVAFMYGDGASPYAGFDAGLHRIAPGLHETVEKGTTDMWARSDEAWNPRAVSLDELGDKSAAFDKDQVEMFRGGVYHAFCNTAVAREVLGVAPRAACGLSLGEVSMLFAFGPENAKKSDQLTARLAASPVWTEQLAVKMNALRSAWGLPADAPVGSFWRGFVLHATKAQVAQGIEAMGAAAGCVRLLIVNDNKSCLIAGKPEQCEALIARLGCQSSPLEQGMVGHCAEVGPHKAAISHIHGMLSMPPASDVQLFWSSGARVEPLSDKNGAHVGDLCAELYNKLADFERVVHAVHAKQYDVFVELGSGDKRAAAVHSILSEGGARHVAVAIDAKGQPAWQQMLRMAAKLISHGGTGCGVRKLYHPKLLAEAGQVASGTAPKPSKLRRLIEINGRFNSSSTPRPSRMSTPMDERLLRTIKRIPTAFTEGATMESSLAARTPSTASLLEVEGGGTFGSKGSALEYEIEYQREQARKYKGPLLWDFDDLLEYAEGNIAPVFNKHLSGSHPPWAEVPAPAPRPPHRPSPGLAPLSPPANTPRQPLRWTRTRTAAGCRSASTCSARASPRCRQRRTCSSRAP